MKYYIFSVLFFEKLDFNFGMEKMEVAQKCAGLRTRTYSAEKNLASVVLDITPET